MFNQQVSRKKFARRATVSTVYLKISNVVIIGLCSIESLIELANIYEYVCIKDLVQQFKIFKNILSF